MIRFAVVCAVAYLGLVVSRPLWPALEGEPQEFQLRVGLATDVREVVLAGRHAMEVIAGGQVVDQGSHLVVRPTGDVVRAWSYRLQIAALREPAQAQRLAEDLERFTGLSSDLAFDAETGLTRVRLGIWHQRQDAVAAQARLSARGRDAWVVEEIGEIANAGLQITGSRAQKAGTTVVVRRSDGGPMAWAGGTYRGGLQLTLNRRGSINVVLVTELENYLRGVVPREMGPKIYNDLDALKALAVAARSYVLHNLGEFAAEGFDVCATPRCQVFGGLGAEQPLSNQAVSETAGLVLVTADRRPADTLYTATCGGHTEDVATVFPAKHHSYLRGVPCIEGGLVSIGRRGDWTVIESRVMRRLIGDLGSSPREVGESFRRLMKKAGLTPGEDRLESFIGSEVRRFLGSVLDLVADPAWFSATVADDHQPLAGSLRRLPKGSKHVLLADLRRILYQVAQEVALVVEQSTKFVARSQAAFKVQTQGSAQGDLLLPGDTVWHWQAPGDGLLAAGDPVRVVLVEGDPVAALIPARSSRNASRAPGTKVWSEHRSDSDLARRASAEFPGFGYRSFELGERGVSGRLKTFKLHGTGGETRELKGLSIRWFLDIPETWFRVRRSSGSQQAPGWVFSGRGWGHGVGMCQRGAYRMALRGSGFTEILDHYYSGLKLEQIDQLGAIRTAAPDLS